MFPDRREPPNRRPTRRSRYPTRNRSRHRSERSLNLGLETGRPTRSIPRARSRDTLQSARVQESACALAFLPGSPKKGSRDSQSTLSRAQEKRSEFIRGNDYPHREVCAVEEFRATGDLCGVVAVRGDRLLRRAARNALRRWTRGPEVHEGPGLRRFGPQEENDVG